MLPAILSAALRRIQDTKPVTDAELRSVKVVLDTDVDKEASAFVKESVSLGVRLKDQNLKESTKALWVPLQKSFMAWWRALNRLRAKTDQEGTAADKEDVIVTEQKLLTWLNCFVLYRNPTPQYESVRTHVKAIKNLWEFQVALKKNSNDAPDGHLVKQYLKAISLSRAAQSRLRGDDKFTNTLKDGYDVKGLVDISRWFLLQASDVRRQYSATRDRFSFLWQHAIVGRSEDLRDRDLSDFYLPNSTPQACPIIVSTQLSSKTNKEARPERGVAARHKDVEVCSVGSFAIYLFARFHCEKEAPPNFAARETWYKTKLLVAEGCLEPTIAITYETQSALLKQAFSSCAITSSALTHAMRRGGSRVAYEAGCTEDDVRKHGRWCGDRMMERYLTGVSIQPVRALSGFKIEGGDYWLPRALLEPPQELAQSIFPWVEPSYKQIQARVLVGGKSDSAALEFLTMLKFLRVVLLQDAAILQDQCPSPFLFSYAPFNTKAFSNYQTSLLTKINSTPTPFDMQLEQLMPTVGNALAGLRSTVEKLRTDMSTTTAKLEASVRALAMRQEQQHAEVMGAIGVMLVMGQGNKQSQAQTRLVQSALAEGLKSIVSVWQHVSLLSTTTSAPFSHYPTSSFPPLTTTAAAATTTATAPTADGGTLGPLGPLSLSSFCPPSSLAPGVQSGTLFGGPSQVDRILLALTGSSTPNTYQLPSLRSATQLWKEWTEAQDGREALDDMRATDEQHYEQDKTYSRRLQSSPAVKQQVYRWSKVVTFIKELSVEARVEGSTIAELLDAQIRKEKGRLARPLRTMADMVTNDTTRDVLAQSILASAKSP
ncbi:hypothetical protein A4X09_0g7056 [Tilletia walkeri]|uniref:Ndc10 domain-containing protein n=1 Tax=Tilletia walkeri TaxID=117179 RepID=A0A8X7N2M5_9BASI|nr:hypothetical protein A4X09_0g7056 [Tilletia walkeri]